MGSITDKTIKIDKQPFQYKRIRIKRSILNSILGDNDYVCENVFKKYYIFYKNPNSKSIFIKCLVSEPSITL